MGSFSLASMMATTLFLWMRVPAVKNQYQSALIISGMVTFIAAYHYLRIFNSWVEAYEYKPNSSGEVEDPKLTGVPFNDAYRYMDWLLTVPLLLIEIVFVMKLPDDQIRNKSIALGVSSGLMICTGYPGELVVEGNLGVRWVYWAIALCPFVYVVYELLVGLVIYVSQRQNLRVPRRALCCHSKFSACEWQVFHCFRALLEVLGPSVSLESFRGRHLLFGASTI